MRKINNYQFICEELLLIVIKTKLIHFVWHFFKYIRYFFSKNLQDLGTNVEKDSAFVYWLEVRTSNQVGIFYPLCDKVDHQGLKQKLFDLVVKLLPASVDSNKSIAGIKNVS